MALNIGSRLGHYDVTALIGEGGMGQVYRATDTQLGRDVALKILPDAFAADPDRLARFQREAQVLASLNHPGIAAIYGIEKSAATQALVLELVEGPTLADRIAEGPIPVDEALPIAKQIAEALEAAHEAGVIHRDLKPANIKVREDGTVKVLDFGLAKALDTTPEGDPDESPTLTAVATRAGVILGTTAYMSPEQAKGRQVDKRTDIWAFGAVLFEMLTGKRAFGRGDVTETLARVIEREPDFGALPAGTPDSIRRLVRRCLAKDRKRRLPDIGAARLELDDVMSGASPEAMAGVASQSSMWRLALPVSLGTFALGGLVTGLTLWPATPVVSPTTRFTVTAPVALSNQNYGYDVPTRVDVSRDGRTLVFAGEDQLYRRDLSQPVWHPIPGTENGVFPRLSPNSERLAFVDDGLKIVPTNGGPAVTLVDWRQVRNPSWTSDDTIVFARGESGLFRIAIDGGNPERLTSSSLDGGRVQHRRPDVVPGGAVALYELGVTSGAHPSEIGVVSLATGERRSLLAGGNPR